MVLCDQIIKYEYYSSSPYFYKTDNIITHKLDEISCSKTNYDNIETAWSNDGQYLYFAGTKK